MKPNEISEIEKDMFARILVWLGYDGIAFFQMCVDEYGSLVQSIWTEDGIPHSVHFREGMHVRNFLRGLTYTENWDAHDFDNRWMHIIQTALSLCEAISKKKGGEV